MVGSFISRKVNNIDRELYCFFPLSTDLMEVVAWLLHPKPEQRATVNDMMRDPWVQQPINIEEYCFKDVLPNCGK